MRKIIGFLLFILGALVMIDIYANLGYLNQNKDSNIDLVKPTLFANESINIGVLDNGSEERCFYKSIPSFFWDNITYSLGNEKDEWYQEFIRNGTLVGGYSILYNNTIVLFPRYDYSTSPEGLEWKCNHEYCHVKFQTQNEEQCDDFADTHNTSSCKMFLEYLWSMGACKDMSKS